MHYKNTMTRIYLFGGKPGIGTLMSVPLARYTLPVFYWEQYLASGMFHIHSPSAQKAVPPLPPGT